MYNINTGFNEEIMDACRTLKEYALYVERVRTYAKQMPLAEAVDDEELHFKSLIEEGRELLPEEMRNR